MTKPNDSPAAAGCANSRINFNVGLSEEEKRDLETMIFDFQKERSQQLTDDGGYDIIKQMEQMNKRLNNLASMFLELDRRMRPLYETIRLTYMKNELLNQRIDAIIQLFQSGEKR